MTGQLALVNELRDLAKQRASSVAEVLNEVADNLEAVYRNFKERPRHSDRHGDRLACDLIWAVRLACTTRKLALCKEHEGTL